MSGWASRMCCWPAATSSSSVSPRTTYPQSQLITFAMSSSSRSVGWMIYRGGCLDVGATLEQGSTRIQLCGQFVVRRGPERLEDRLPGRQERLLLAYLVLHRTRRVGRDELVEAIWPRDAPSAPGIALRVLLSRLRACLGADTVADRSDLRLTLPGDAWVDVEAAEEAIHLAEAAVAQREWFRAYAPAKVACYISERVFLAGHDAPWID